MNPGVIAPNHAFGKRGAGHALEVAPFARDINEPGSGVACATHFCMKNSTQNTVLASAFPAIQDHRGFVLLKAPRN